MIQLNEISVESSQVTDDEIESWFATVLHDQRGINWWIGDLAILAERFWQEKRRPGTWHQLLPVDVSPGLIDLHTHVYWGGTSLGIDTDEFCRSSGVTTSVDTGSAGPGNFAGFRKHVIEPATSRVLVYLHVSFAGIYAFSPTIMVGEAHDMRLMASREALAVARAVGIGAGIPGRRAGKVAARDFGTIQISDKAIVNPHLQRQVVGGLSRVERERKSRVHRIILVRPVGIGVNATRGGIHCQQVDTNPAVDSAAVRNCATRNPVVNAEPALLG